MIQQALLSLPAQQQPEALADLDLPTLKRMREIALLRLEDGVLNGFEQQEYRQLIARVDFEVEARSRRRDAEFATLCVRVLVALIVIGVLAMTAVTAPTLAYLSKQTMGTALGLGVSAVFLNLTGAVLAVVNFWC